MTDVPPDVVSDAVLRLRAAGCVFAEEEAAILTEHASRTADPMSALTGVVERRVAGEPLEVIVGWAEFCGLRVRVAPGVFVPRKRTEYLVQTALPRLSSGMTVIDLCCGSGAIGVALATSVPGLQVHACDIDPVAATVAADNLRAVGGTAYCGDLFAPLPGSLLGALDLVAVNAPYVPTSDIALMPPEARDHEPRHTLDGGPDGVDLHRRVAADVAAWLRPGGRVLIETSDHQSDHTAAALSDAGLRTTVEHSDELYATVVTGVLAVRFEG